MTDVPPLSIPNSDVTVRQVLGTEDYRLCSLGCQKRSHVLITVVPKPLLPLRSEQLRKLAQVHLHQSAPFLTAIVEDIRIQAPSDLNYLFNIYWMLRKYRALCYMLGN